MSTYCTPHSLSINFHIGQNFYNINRERSQTTKHMPLLQLKSSQSHRISWLESTLFPIKCGKIRSSQHLSYNIPTYGQFSLTEKKYFFVNVKNVKCAVDREKEMLVDCTVEGLYIKHLIASLQQTSKVFILSVPVVGKEKLATVKDRAWGLKKKMSSYLTVFLLYPTGTVSASNLWEVKTYLHLFHCSHLNKGHFFCPLWWFSTCWVFHSFSEYLVVTKSSNQAWI